jgi:uncharacterized protein YqgV (UPF0045/DUF77 family)
MESDELIGATVAVYPFQSDSTAAIHRSIEALEACGVEVVTGPMSTLVMGTADQVFAALRGAYDAAASTGAAVVTVTVSNACPLPEADDAPISNE